MAHSPITIFVAILIRVSTNYHYFSPIILTEPHTYKLRKNRKHHQILCWTLILDQLLYYWITCRYPHLWVSYQTNCNQPEYNLSWNVREAQCGCRQLNHLDLEKVTIVCFVQKKFTLWRECQPRGSSSIVLASDVTTATFYLD